LLGSFRHPSKLDAARQGRYKATQKNAKLLGYLDTFMVLLKIIVCFPIRQCSKPLLADDVREFCYSIGWG
jgi:hypothetical protein